MLKRIASLLALTVAPFGFAQDDAAEKAPPAAERKEQALDVSSLPFTPDSIRMVIEESAQPRVQECYEQLLAASGKPPEGKLATTFVIKPDGTVKSAQVARAGTTLKSAKLHQCVSRVLQSLVFPKPPDGKNYPIEFPFNLKAIK